LAIDEEAEVPAVEEAVMSAEDNADGRRQLFGPGLPDRYGWANGGTYWCANEGGWCPCYGHVTYTKKCAGTFSCNQASWETVVSQRWLSNHRANVVSGSIPCNNAHMKGDPWPGYDKQCFCHPSDSWYYGRRQLAIDEEAEVPAVEEAVMSAEDNADDRRHLAGLPDRYGWARQEQPTQYDYVQKWTEPRCNQQCGSPGAGWFSSDWWKGVWCGFSCTGVCPARAAAFAAGREHTFPIGQCAEHCYCVFKGWTG